MWIKWKTEVEGWINNSHTSLTHCCLYNIKRGLYWTFKSNWASCFLQPRLMLPLTGLLARIGYWALSPIKDTSITWVEGPTSSLISDDDSRHTEGSVRNSVLILAGAIEADTAPSCSPLPPAHLPAPLQLGDRIDILISDTRAHSLEWTTAFDVSAEVPDETGHLKLWVHVPFYFCLKRITYCNSLSTSWLTLAGNMWCPLVLSHSLLILIPQWAPRGHGIRWSNQHSSTLSQSIQKVREHNSWAKDGWKLPVLYSQPHNTSAIWNRYIDASSTTWNINAPEKNKWWLTGNVANSAGNFWARKRISTCT